MDVETQDISQQLSEISAQVAALSEQVGYIARKQKEREELFSEMQPIVKAMMGTATDELQSLEDKGYFTFGREALRVVDRIVEGYSEEDVQALGDNIVRIMDTIRALTQPRVLAIANDATEAIDKADELEPTGVLGMVRASRDEDVQRGMAVFLAVLRAVGAGVKELSDEPKRAETRRALPAPATATAPAAPAAKRAQAAPKAAPQAGPVQPVVIGGVAFDDDGYLADPSQWTEELARALAASQGVPELTERHWVAIMAARNDYLENGVSPNIRRITMISDVTTKELYQLFPKAPGMTLARVAGIPKPVGCI
ncbi:MAG TPA: TusE/DsrC/DsvC family sulfur relay protein [Polyangiaceae bacterium]|nr:TusE/DsrC/DsvC family sulfur relay protein [Polyangiaceae bacterium]